jgi:protein TonB
MAFEAILTRPDVRPRRWRRVTFSVSLVLHGVALAVGLVYSLWEVEEMPLPAIQVTLTDAPPPPPPPPPPAGGKKSTSKPKTRIPTKTEIVQPRDTPKEEKPQSVAEDDGQENGQVGGELGGVVGGVVGGVIGSQPPPPPPKDTTPQQVGAGAGARQLAINPTVPPYCCPTIPRALEDADSFSAVLRVCVSTQGEVTEVRILRGAGPALDSQIPAFVQRWRYKPLLVNGEPRAFCYPVRYEISQR